MSWQQRRPENVATTSFLEERINMYISAMDTASAVNDSHQSSQLQRDIQKLVDLMERVGAGEEIMESQVPPPLAITPQIGVLPNALGELSARLSDYHKALYFAEEELSEDRTGKIQGMQRALQAIHNLQKRAEAGFPIRADEVPPPVSIPSDDEFDNDAVNTISKRLAHYQELLKTAEGSEGTDRKRISKIQSTLRTLEFLMTRAKAKRPVWKKDIPPEFDYSNVSPKGSPSMNKTKYLLVVRSLILRLSAPPVMDSDIGETATITLKKLKTLEEELVKKKDAQPWLRSGNSLPELTKAVEKLEKLAAKKKASMSNVSQNLALLEVRIREYTAAALKAKKDNQMTAAIKHFKVLKGLQALKESIEKGGEADMTLVPPAPRDYTPTSESLPPLTQAQEGSNSQPERGSSQGETARLLPVNVCHMPETAEDKLAQKLTSYLNPSDDEDLGDSVVGTGQHNVIANNMSKSTASLLKKVQNSAVKLPAEKVLYGDPGFSGTVLNEEEAKENKEDTIQANLDVVEPMNGSDPGENSTEADNVRTENTKIEEGATGAIKKTTKLTAAVIENNDSDSKKNIHHLEPQTENGPTKVETADGTPKSSPKTSNEIYSRKTLDSVGFLSCQTVPDINDKLKQVAATDAAINKQGNQWNHRGASNIENMVSNGPSGQEQIDVTSKHDESYASGSTYVRSSIDSNIETNKNVNEENILVGNQHVDQNSEGQSISEGTAGLISDHDSIEDKKFAGASSNLQHEECDTELETSTKPMPNGLESGISISPTEDVPSTCLSQTSDASLEMTNKIETQNIAPQLSHPDLNSVAPVSSLVESTTMGENNQTAKEVKSELLPASAAGLGDFISLNNTEQKSLDISHQSVNSAAKTIPTSCSSDELEFQDLMASMLASPVVSTIAESNDKFMPESSEKNGSQVKSISGSASKSLILPKEESIKFDQHNFLNLSEGVGSNHPSTNLSSLVKPVEHILPMSLNSNGLPSSLNTNFPPEERLLSLPNGFDSRTDSYSGKSLTMSATKYPQQFQTDVVFTCLENLKYDLLVEKSKNQNASSEEILKLERRMDQIKAKLSQSGRLIWELYKTCVESELTSITNEIGALQSLSQDDYLLTLQHKQRIAKRELNLLQERLPRLSY